MALGQALDGLRQPGGLHLAHHLTRRIGGALVLDQGSQLRRALVRAQGLVQAARVGHRALDVAYLLDAPPELLRDLLVGGVAPQPGRELVVGARHLAHLVPHVDRNADGPSLVCYSPLHSLPDPPRRIRREPKAPCRVKLLYSLHQAYVALLDEVLKGQPIAPILLGYTDHKAKVFLYEALAGLLVACLGSLTEIYLLCVRQQLTLADVSQIFGEQLRGLHTLLYLLRIRPFLSTR